MSRALHLIKAERRQVDAAAAVLRPWGLAWALGKDGPHLHMLVAGPRGGHWRLTLACTPRDQDEAVRFAERNAKRLVRVINQRVLGW